MWLKSLSPGMKLERLSLQFESREFRSRPSLAYVKSEDLDSFFPSPDKLLLAERRVLEAELNNIKTETCHQPNQCSHLEPKRLNMNPSLKGVEKSVNLTSQQQASEAAIDFGFEASCGASATTSNQTAEPTQSPLDRRAVELSENLKLLEVQVKSAKFIYNGNKNPWKIYLMFMRGGEKCVPFVTRLATTEQIVRKVLATMSTLVSLRTNTQN